MTEQLLTELFMPQQLIQPCRFINGGMSTINPKAYTKTALNIVMELENWFSELTVYVVHIFKVVVSYLFVLLIAFSLICKITAPLSFSTPYNFFNRLTNFDNFFVRIAVMRIIQGLKSI